jgi:hypothetical protein
MMKLRERHTKPSSQDLLLASSAMAVKGINPHQPIACAWLRDVMERQNLRPW